MAIAVAKGLYIGDEATLQQAPELGITHVLSVINYEVQVPDGLCQWQVTLEDSESANLLAELPAAVQWLQRAMRQTGSKVLVHCNAGTSRSPAVVVAAIMAAKALPLSAALAVLQARAPHASPNPGFLAQLELWGEMGCQLDEAHPGYKAFLLDQVACQWEEEGWVDPGRFADLPEDEQTLAPLVRYRCRKCRQLIVTELNVIPQTGVGRRVFRRQRHQQQQQQQQQQGDEPGGADDGARLSTASEQGSLFVEPMGWMADQIVGPVQGKLYCTSCNARLGSFNWAGITNSSGAWMVPGLQLHLARIDTVSPHKPAALAGMRFPTALADRQPQQLQQPEGQPGSQPEQQPDASQLQQLQLQDSGQQDATPAAAAATAGAAVQEAPASAAAAAAGSCWFRYLLLDCDGVLVDSEAASCEALHRAILEVTGVDIPHAFPRDYHAVFGMTVRGCVEHYKAHLNRSDWVDVESIIAAVSAAKEVHYQQLTAGGIAALPGAAALIRQAQALGLPVGVGSSGAPAKIARNLASSGLLPLLDSRFIVSAAEVASGKPAPDVYLEVLARMAAASAAGSIGKQCDPGSSSREPREGRQKQPADCGSCQTDAGGGGGGGARNGNGLTADDRECGDGEPGAAVSGSKAGEAARMAPAGLDASRALVVEDAVHGLVAARAAGAFAVGVTNSLPAALLQPHADLVVSSLEELDLMQLRPKGM